MRTAIIALLLTLPSIAHAADVTVPANGDIQGAIDQAMPGDVVTLSAGTYDTGELVTARDGTAAAPVTVIGEGEVILRLTTGDSRVVDVQHAYFRLETVTIDGQFANARGMRIDDGAVGFVMRNVEVRNTANHCIDIRNTSDILIEDSRIHHCLNWNNGRVDAHGISASAVQGLTIRNTEIHTFTGDALQVDPARTLPGWRDVVVDGCTFWLGPVNDGSGGVPAGVVPGENAIDTKTADGAVGNLTIRNTFAYGFRNGEISNMAAFNLKEDVDVTIDAVVVADSEIAFRIRGRASYGAQPRLTNVLIYDVDTALRLEDDLQATIPVHHVTFGDAIGQLVDTAGGADAAILDPRNVVVLGTAPPELPGAIAAVGSQFESVPGNIYVPSPSASWLDSGEDLGLDHDLRGALRPQGDGPDPGAFEFGEGPAADMGFPPIVDMGAPGNNATPGDMGGSGDFGGEGPDGSTPPAADAGPGSESGCQCGTTRSPASLLWILVAIAFRRRSHQI